jgi:hypothetical protein
MKKLLFILGFILPLALYGQNTFKYPVNANGGLRVGGADHSLIDSAKVVNSHFSLWRGSTPYYGISDTTGLEYIDGLTSDAQDQLDALSADIDTLETDTVDIDDVALALTDYAIMLNDTIQLFVFGGGGGNAGDTAVFTTSTIYGSFFNESRDTLVITALRCVMLHGIGTDTLSVDIFWDANLNDATPTKLNAAPFPCTSITTGDEDTSFAETKIPPDVWVWCETPGVVAGRKPTYFNAQISGYIKRTE